MTLVNNQSFDIDGNLVVDEWVEIPDTIVPELKHIAELAGIDIPTLLTQVQKFLIEQNDLGKE